MKVGLLIICHEGIGPVMLGATTLMLGEPPLPVKVLSASRDSDPDEVLGHATELVKNIDQGAGVLVMTDLYGSTPCNIAKKLGKNNNIRVVSGLNLSMLIRVMNYPNLAIDDLAHKAVSGGQEGIRMVT